ncbi:hypothetical protein Ciccas_001962 [Cichlidogyrus casuarinus]|uniref:Clathrin light chain n=1 Tax=Cichlidogyrus casuarinus TaxID=1844966 RepID=A0ABD2QIW2_9PLAT
MNDTKSDSLEKWWTTFQDRITEKDRLEQEKVIVMESAASKELSEWCSAYEKELGQIKEKNLRKDVEAKKIHEENKAISSSFGKVDATQIKIWERISDLCEISHSNAKMNTREEIQRMRAILMSLKSQPVKKF